jgi:photosystem II stability/assembly factor-like uncharacterized protein
LDPALIAQNSGSDALFIGLSIVNDSVTWVAGTGGSWAQTTNGGERWRTGTVAGADSLQFRDVHGVDERTAYLLSIGNGAQSRIYKTTDGGSSWSLQFTNPDSSAFYDCFDFWDATHGIAFSDSFDGRFMLIETEDGETWAPLAAARRPVASAGEGGFASSGTCVVAASDSTVWIGTGASDDAARVLRSTDRGRTWQSAATGIVRGSAAGITSLAFRDTRNGVAIGGDIGQPDSTFQNVSLTTDGGVTWRAGTPTPFAGAAYSVTWVPDAPSPTLVAAGPRGLAFSTDAAATWTLLDTLNHWNVGFAAPDRGWAIGPRGRITRMRIFSRP